MINMRSENKEILTTKMESFEDFVKMIVISNPREQVHCAFRKNKIYYIFYGCSKELIYCVGEKDVRAVEIEPETLKIKTEPTGLEAVKKYVFFFDVERSEILKNIYFEDTKFLIF